MGEVCDPGVTQLHERLDEIALSSPILAVDDLEDLARPDEAVAGVGVCFVVGDPGVGVCVVVEEVVLNQDGEAISQLSRA